MKTLILFAIALSAFAQATRPFVRASGEGIVSAEPDLFRINVSVQTRAATAQEAAEQNATATRRVMDALRGVIGSTGDLKTTSYFVNPDQRVQNGQTTTVGYIVVNSLEVSSTNLDLPGRVIDTGIQAGATTVNGLRFTVRDFAPLRAEALKKASAMARRQAEAIAGGLNMRLGAIYSLEEGFVTRPVGNERLGVGAVAPSTPVEAGLVEVQAVVTLEAELMR